MINLEDVSIRNVYKIVYFTYIKNNGVGNFNCPFLDELKNVDLENCKQLKELIEQRDSKLSDPFLKECLNSIEGDLKKANEMGHDPIIYKADGYDRFNLDRQLIEKLRKSDKNVCASELLFTSPIMSYSVKKQTLSLETVYSIKQLLEHCIISCTSYKGINALIYCLEHFGLHNVGLLIKSISFYEEQVIRQLKELDNIFEDNIFEKNYEQKIKIVESQINDLTQYFVDNANICIWGELTESQKRKLMQSVNSKNCLENQIIVNFINMIANYTTLSELEEGIIKTKVINRFIKK